MVSRDQQVRSDIKKFKQLVHEKEAGEQGIEQTLKSGHEEKHHSAEQSSDKELCDIIYNKVTEFISRTNNELSMNRFYAEQRSFIFDYEQKIFDLYQDPFIAEVALEEMLQGDL